MHVHVPKCFVKTFHTIRYNAHCDFNLDRIAPLVTDVTALQLLLGGTFIRKHANSFSTILILIVQLFSFSLSLSGQNCNMSCTSCILIHCILHHASLSLKYCLFSCPDESLRQLYTYPCTYLTDYKDLLLFDIKERPQRLVTF